MRERNREEAPPAMAGSEEVFSWLKSLPVAPEYRPTAAEFQDPIAYIFKIEKEASKYGICKIIPPVPPSPKKTVISHLNRSQPNFTTRQQQIGFCPRRPQPVRRPVWHSGHHYSFRDFEAKAKSFEKTYLKKCRKSSPLSPLEVETLYWKATVDKPFSVEYANDMPGSAFGPPHARDAAGDTVGDTAWNMRGVSRANGSLLRFMKEEIPGVTSPMVYVAMLFSWFAWHVEDHDLHSLNYLHFGAPKTWYGVPRDAAVAFEEVVRVHGYGGEINPLVTFAILGEKTTVMSPEVFIGAGVPCCRLVQNAGEFVVTFPRAYHTGFSLGFNCGEAANIATPEWLRVAKDAAIRRASINYPPMVSHFQLLYDLGLALCSRIPGGINAEPRSSRLKDKRKGEGETVIKELFVQDVLQNNDLLHILSKGSAIVLLPRSSSDLSVCSKLRIGSQQLKVNPEFPLNLCNSEAMNSSKGFISDDLVFNRNNGIKQVKGFYSVKDKFATLCERSRVSPFSMNGNMYTSGSKTLPTDTENETSQGDGLSDQRLFSCVTCGILSFSCVAIVQPREPAARCLADCSFFNDWIVGSGVTSSKFSVAQEDANIPKPITYTGWTKEKAQNDLYDLPVQSVEHQTQIADKKYEEALNSESKKGNTALALLASVYGNSDSEEDQGDSDVAVDGDEHPSASRSEDMSSFPSYFQDSHASSMVRLDKGDDIPSKSINNYEYYMHKRVERIMSPFDHSVKSEDHDITSGVAFRNSRAMIHSILNCSQDTQTNEDSSRMHIFCLEHAAEAEQRLREIGGAHILLLCHPDYPKIEAEAKFVAEELGIDYMWKNTVYRHASREDEERIQSALDNEEAIPGNGDWAVKLGINLFYSANLSRSPLYSKQMPYNSVIYYAFGRSSPASSAAEPKVYQRRANKQKKIVAGKWCGKVWMSNQVHPLLAKRDSEDVEDEKSLHGWSLPDEKIEKSESNHKSNILIRKSVRKRKMTVESGGTREGSFAERDWLSDNSIEDKSNQDQRRILGSKRSRHIEREDTASEGDYSPLLHHRKLTSKHHTKCIESDAASDDSLDDDSRIQHWRKANGREAKYIDSDVVSDDTMDYDSDWPHRGEHSNKQDAISEDSLGVGSLQLHRKTPKSKYGQYIAEEDVVSDDQMEVCFRKQKGKISKSKQRRYLPTKGTAISDDQLEHKMQKQQRRNPKSRQDKYLAGDDILSDDQLEGHSRKYQRRISKSRQAKCVEEEDVMSDDQLEDHFQKPQRSVRRSRQNKYSDGEVMDDSAENNSHLLYRTPRRKQAKCMDDDNINSDDQIENNSHQQQRRTLRSKQSKSQILQQMKQTNPHRVGSRSKTSRPVKRGTHIMKSKAARRMKQQPRVWNNQSGNSRDLTLHVEEEEEGGPSTRLRKRVPKIQESEGKIKEKESKRKKVKNATAAKVSAGHAKVKDEESEYQCDIEGCTMSFGSKQELVQHKKNICPVKGCGKKFFSHKYLVQHRRVHEDDRPLKCPWKGCKMTFKWAWARTEHIRVHTGARPYVCAEPGCGQTFRFVSDFSRHKRKTGHSTKKSR